jgi:primosomal protein N'
MRKNHKKGGFVVCAKNKGYEASLELRKIYQAVPDTGAARHHLLRVVDEAGEDYLYPQDFFVSIVVPKPIEKALWRSHE